MTERRQMNVPLPEKEEGSRIKQNSLEDVYTVRSCTDTHTLGVVHQFAVFVHVIGDVSKQYVQRT